MPKTVRLERRELVWEYYSTEWDATDYKALVEWLKERNDEYSKSVYDTLAALSWDSIVRMFNGEEEEIYISVHTSYNDYKESVIDYIKEQMREDLWNNGPYDSEYADDSDEDISTTSYPDEESGDQE